MKKGELAERIRELKSRKGAAVLAHNYQRAEIQEVADYVGDTLGLIRRGMEAAAGTIVLCGIRFMAQMAKALSPEKTVLIPRRQAGCPMANTIAPEDVRRLRSERPHAVFVSFVNTEASVMAECDVCCTSSNATTVVNRLDADEVVFLPDRNLAHWVARHSSKKIIPWTGFCFVHERIDPRAISKLKERHPETPVVVHPGCRPEAIDCADEVRSTAGMVEFVVSSPAERIVFGSEEGLLQRLMRENPGRIFHTVGPARMCKNMKMTTLEDLFLSLREEKHAVALPSEMAAKVQLALSRMFDLCGENE